MEGGQGAFPSAAETAHQLKQAAGIGGDDCLGLGVEEMVYLAIAELLRGFRLKEVVDAGGATAERGFGYFGNFELRNCGEKLTGLLMNSLSMTQVACIVISDADGERMTQGPSRQTSEDFSDVFAFCGEGVGLDRPIVDHRAEGDRTLSSWNRSQRR